MIGSNSRLKFIFPHLKPKTFFTNVQIYFVLFLAGSLITFASSAHAAPVQLKVSGNQIVTASGGCTVRLHGVNYSGTEYNATGQPAGNTISGVPIAVGSWEYNPMP